MGYIAGDNFEQKERRRNQSFQKRNKKIKIQIIKDDINKFYFFYIYEVTGHVLKIYIIAYYINK